MADLMKWDKPRPDNFYTTVTHLWLQYEDGTIDVVERRTMTKRGEWRHEDDDRPSIHADHWGELAWETDCRGYYSQSLGMVTAHVGFDGQDALINKLARKFRDAMYYCD